MPDASAPAPYLTLLWYGGSGLIDRAIQWFTHSRYSHSAVMVRGILYEEQAPGLIMHAGGAATQRAAQAIAYKVVPLSPVQESAIVGFLSVLITQHAHYNYAELLGQALHDRVGIPIVIANNNDYVCSAVCAQCLIYADQIPPMDARLISPAQLADWQAPVTAGPPLIGA